MQMLPLAVPFSPVSCRAAYVLSALLAAWSTCDAIAQAPVPKAPAPMAKAPAVAAPAAAPPAKKEEVKLPDPEEVTLEAKDGMLLKGTYYPGTLKKKAVPVIMIHGWEGTRKEFDGLARVIQQMGHAVISFDLRGHGESKTRKHLMGEDDEVDVKKLQSKLRVPTKEELPRMVALDLERVKTFLREKNNEGELNLDLLCVVGSEYGAILAAEWAMLDWSWPVLAAGKQGQDVKGIAMLSPPVSSNARPMPTLATSNIRDIAYLMIAGKKEAKAVSDAKRLFGPLEKYHWKLPPDTKKEDEPKVRALNQTLFLSQPDTKLQGTKLLTDPATFPIVARDIAGFIQLRMVNKAEEYPWAERK